MNGVALMKQARSLAEIPADDMKASLQKLQTETDLAALRIGYVICRRRHETEKCKLIASRIRRLEKEQPWTQKIN
jgi:hypothetical protein